MWEEGGPVSLGLVRPPGTLDDKALASAGMCPTGQGGASSPKERSAHCCRGSYC